VRRRATTSGPASLEQLVGDDVPTHELSRLARVDALLRLVGPVQPVRFADSEQANEYLERSGLHDDSGNTISLTQPFTFDPGPIDANPI
jgi:hypothetical protein